MTALGFGIENLPFGVARLPGGGSVCVTRIEDEVVDLSSLSSLGLDAPLAQPTLNPFLALGRPVVSQARHRLADLLSADDRRLRAARHPLDDVELLLPIQPGDFVDFSASIHHAVNMGRLLRAGSEPLKGNWRSVPRAYHGRTGTLVASGTPIHRPHGQTPDGLQPTAQLDIEAEVGFVIAGPGNQRGRAIPVSQADQHVAGLLLVNDWSARDFQAYEAEPLGPFLAKSFATSVSPWLVTLDALEPYRVAPPPQDPPPPPYLRLDGPWAYDVTLEVERNGATTARCPFAGMYWTIPQLLAHATVNGATVRAGDLFACGTTSGPDPGTYGSLIEAGSGFLDDGDTVTIRGYAGPLVSLGEVTATVLPALPLED